MYFIVSGFRPLANGFWSLVSDQKQEARSQRQKHVTPETFKLNTANY
jgi:hypothetical protein